MIWALSILVIAGIVALPRLLEAQRAPMDDARRTDAPGQFADLSQGTTHYQWHGPSKGTVAVCIHGLTTSSYVFDEFVPVLTQMGYRVLTYDLFGRGLSDRPDGVQNRGFFLTQLRDLLEHEGIGGDLMIVGNSMGGGIATAFSAAEWERVDRLLLFAPTGLAPGITDRMELRPVIGDWLALTVFGRRERRRIAEVDLRSPALPDLPERQMAETRTQGYAAAVLSSMRHMISDVMDREHKLLRDRFTATLAIWGGLDDVIPGQAAGNLADWNREAHQVTFDDAGHGLIITHPDQIRSALQDWLREV